jgi:hypothetical protein
VGEWRNGRRAWLRTTWGNSCRFKSCLAHHSGWAGVGDVTLHKLCLERTDFGIIPGETAYALREAMTVSSPFPPKGSFYDGTARQAMGSIPGAPRREDVRFGERGERDASC